MKFRQGFVSNSSSTSFCAYGFFIEHSDIKKLNTVDVNNFDNMEEYICKVFTDNDTDLEYIFGEFEIFIGLPYEFLKNDETGREFKERAKNNFKGLKKYLDMDPPIHEDDFQFINTEVSTI